MAEETTPPALDIGLTADECLLCEIALANFMANLDLSMYSGQRVAQVINKLEYLISKSLSLASTPPAT
ncbi:unnamed protein product [marine sediment metagenome]|uniref:Uncharacterized protein n=1 Tax=marine sediment metagenome TaxID=412755 RepID=X1JNS0_9ZZZZ